MQTPTHPYIDESVEDINIKVICSYVEIYNDLVFDLLDDELSKVSLKEDSHGITYIDGCKEVQVLTTKDVMDLL